VRLWASSAIAVGALVVSAAGVVSACAAQDAAPDNIELIRTGRFLGDGPWPADGAQWFGVYADSVSHWLEAVTLRVRRVPDACADSATVITVAGLSDPLFLVRGIPTLSEGPIDVAFTGQKFLYPGESLYMNLGEGRWYTFIAFGIAEPAYSYAVFKSYQIHLRDLNRSQEIASFEVLDPDGLPTVSWAGDLDRDGALDFLADLRTHYAGHTLTLFLSSLAQADDLVTKAAVFQILGC
jgi:hypothetical protein